MKPSLKIACGSRQLALEILQYSDGVLHWKLQEGVYRKDSWTLTFSKDFLKNNNLKLIPF